MDFWIAYIVTWFGVIEHVAELPTWLWLPTYLIGLLSTLVVMLPEVIRMARIYINL